jgi:DNA polymerase elongation subunit (family B)
MSKKEEQTVSNGPRICIIDIETSPGIAHVWGLFKQTIGITQLQEATRVISFAAKWHGEKEVHFFSEFHDGRKKMIQAAHRILSEADIIVHYNGTSFDIPHLKREFWLAKMDPPAPFLEVDLMKAVKRHFRFMSNKLQHVCEQKGLGSKAQTGGHELWVKCLLGDRAAWSLMREYNKHDVVLTEELYNSILPWIDNHPHVGLAARRYEDACNRCGKTNLQYRGYAQTRNTIFRKFQCTDCGGWGRSSKGEVRVKTSGVR